MKTRGIITGAVLMVLHLSLFTTLEAKRSKKKFPTEQNVIVMTDENFEEVLATYENVFIHFYVPFCSHSKNLGQIFAKAYNKYYKKKKQIRFGKINAYVHKKYSKRLNLRGYPTLLFFRNHNLDKSVKFNSDPTPIDLRSFIENQLYKKVKTYSS